MVSIKITKTEVDRAERGPADYIVWDTLLKGFGLKVSKGGTKSYVAQYRTAGGRSGTTKRVTIGKHGSPWTPDTSRDEARRILGQVANGADPAHVRRSLREMPSIAQLCDTYLLDGVGLKKPSTLATDRGRIEHHIKPLLGNKKVVDVTQADVRKFLRNVADGATAKVAKTKLRGKAVVRGGRGTATRTVGLLGGIFSYAIELGLISANPVHGVERFPDKKNERFLSLIEISTLGEALRTARCEGVNEMALTIIELLLLTGARRGEIESLRWSEFDPAGQRLRLNDSKTGQKSVPLGSAAINILNQRRKESNIDATYVFPASVGNGHYLGTPRVWSKLRKSIGMEGVRIHDLRHSFASVGAATGTPLLVIGAILGHADYGTTQRYAHIAANPIATASDSIGALIASALKGPMP